MNKEKMGRSRLNFVCTTAAFLFLCGVPALAHAEGFIPHDKQFKAYGEKKVERIGEGATAWIRATESSSEDEHRYLIDYYSGLATMGIWSVSCGIDAIHGHRWCRASHAALMFYEDNRGAFLLVVGREHFPSSSVYIRIDDSKPNITTAPGWSGQAARSIAKRMTTARVVHARYWEWPHRVDIDESRAPHDIALMLDYLRFAVYADRKPKPTVKPKAAE